MIYKFTVDLLLSVPDDTQSDDLTLKFEKVQVMDGDKPIPTTRICHETMEIVDVAARKKKEEEEW